MVQALSKLDAWYGSWPQTGQHGLIQATEASGAPVLDEVFSDVEVPEGSQDQAYASTEWLMELALSSCPYSGSEDSDLENEESHRRFSRLLSERMLSGGPLLSWVQKHGQTVTVISAAAIMEEGEGPHVPHIEEQGKEFRQNIAVVWDALREEVALPSVGMASRAAQLSSVQLMELPRMGGAVFPLCQLEVSGSV